MKVYIAMRFVGKSIEVYSTEQRAVFCTPDGCDFCGSHDWIIKEVEVDAQVKKLNPEDKALLQKVEGRTKE